MAATSRSLKAVPFPKIPLYVSLVHHDRTLEYGLTVIGLDIMDSHDSYGSRVWYHLSAGHGSGGMFLVVADYS